MCTKCRYMVVRERASSSHSLGFRVDGVMRGAEADNVVAAMADTREKLAFSAKRKGLLGLHGRAG